MNLEKGNLPFGFSTYTDSFLLSVGYFAVRSFILCITTRIKPMLRLWLGLTRNTVRYILGCTQSEVDVHF